MPDFFHITDRLVAVLILGFAILFSIHSGPASAGSLQVWKVSCGADAGSITHRGQLRTFRTSSNRCPGGTYSQRAEIRSDPISPTHSGAYLFQSYVAMTSASDEPFDIFQIHDGRHGCAPPLKVRVSRSGHIVLVSDIKTGPGESCIRGQLSGQQSRDRILRNGTEQHLKVLIEFDGNGGFRATIWIDDVLQISGAYTRPAIPGAFISEKFNFKHGVYSKNIFPYVMTSRDMRVSSVQVQR